MITKTRAKVLILAAVLALPVWTLTVYMTSICAPWWVQMITTMACQIIGTGAWLFVDAATAYKKTYLGGVEALTREDALIGLHIASFVLSATLPMIPIPIAENWSFLFVGMQVAVVLAVGCFRIFRRAINSIKSS